MTQLYVAYNLLYKTVIGYGQNIDEIRAWLNLTVDSYRLNMDDLYASLARVKDTSDQIISYDIKHEGQAVIRVSAVTLDYDWLERDNLMLMSDLSDRGLVAVLSNVHETTPRIVMSIWSDLHGESKVAKLKIESMYSELGMVVSTGLNMIARRTIFMESQRHLDDRLLTLTLIPIKKTDD